MRGAPGLTVHVVNALAAERRRQGRTLEDVADRAGIHRTSLGLIERHSRGVTLDVASAIAASLGISLGQLVLDVERSQVL